MMKISFSILIIMIPVITFGALNMTGPMVVSLLAGFTCAVLINLDRFESFKAGQLEAQIKSAEKTLEEANATIEQLKEVTEPLMNYILAHIVRGNSFIGLPAQDKEKLYSSIKTNSEQLGLKNEYHKQLLNETRCKVVETYLFEIELAVERMVKWKGAEPIREFINKNYAEERLTFPKVSDIKEFFNNHKYLYSDQVEEAIAQYARSLNEFV